MADEEINLRIGVDDKASKVVDALAKKVDKLDGTEAEIDVTADSKKAEKSVAGLLKTVEKLDSESATIVLALEGAKVQKELVAVLQELAQIDALDPSIDVKLGKVTDLKADLDTIKAKVIELNDTPVNIDTSSVRRGIDDIGKSAGSSKSVLANMVGNTTQDLGALGGVAGSAGVAFGQMGEYMADALGSGEKFSSVLKSFAGVAGPLAAIAGAMLFISKVMEANAKQKAFNVDEVKAFSAALNEGGDQAAKLEARLRSAGEVKFEAPASNSWNFWFGNAQNAVDLMDRAHVSVEQFTKGTTGSAEAADALFQSFRRAAEQGLIGSGDLADSLALITQYYNNNSKAAQDLEQQNRILAVSQNSVTDAVKELLETKDPVSKFPGEFKRMADAMGSDFMPSVADVTTVMKGLGITEEEVLAITDKLVDKRHADQLEAEAKATQDLIDVTDGLIERYNERVDALDAVHEAALGANDLQLAAESADLRATQAVADYNEVMKGKVATMEEVADAQKNLTKAQQAYDKSLAVTLPTDDAKARGLLRLKQAQEAYDNSLKVTRSPEMDRRMAVIKLTEAQQEYQKVLADVKSTELDRQKALLNVDQAQQDVNDATKTTTGTDNQRESALLDLKQAQQDYNDMLKGSVDSAEQQQTALENLHDAEQKLVDSTTVVASTQAQKAQAYLDVQSAINNAATAHADLERNQATATGQTYSNRDAIKAEILALQAERDTLKPGSALYNALEGHIKQLERELQGRKDIKAFIDLYGDYAAGFGTGKGGSGTFDQGGVVGWPGGIAGEKHSEILNGKWLTQGPTVVPPGTRVTSSRRTMQFLRRKGLKGYDTGTVGAPIPIGMGRGGNVTINVNAAVIGNRFDVARTVTRASQEASRLLGTRR